MNKPVEKPVVALIIDDEVQIRRLLRLTLEAHLIKLAREARAVVSDGRWSLAAG